MAHILVPAAEEILDKEFPLLNHGFLRLVDYMGGDARIVQAARVSYGAGAKSVRTDAGLVKYLWSNKHTSPFEQVNLTVHAKMPILVARQWVRHRTAKLNEISGRYAVMKDEFYIPDLNQICYQATDNKQGRSGPLPVEEAQLIREAMMLDQSNVYAQYQDYIDRGVAKETARNNLPLSLYTEWYWNIDLHNLLHFLMLRMDPHAQYEIRVYADKLFDMATAVAPVACEAFMAYTMDAVTFSSTELEMLHMLVGLDKTLDVSDLWSEKEIAAFNGKLQKALAVVNRQ